MGADRSPTFDDFDGRLRRFICPVLIAREREAEYLRAALKSAASGHGGAIFLTGEPGIGKSRLLAELLNSPEATALALVRGSGREAEQAEPYSLALQLAQATGIAPARLLGEVTRGNRQARRVAQELAAGLARSAAGRSTVLVVEDLHWADESSLDVLLGLVEHITDLALVATLRPEPLSRGLASFLSEANRRRLSTEVALRPLTRGEVARLIYLTLDLVVPVPGPLLDEVMTATSGNPFLIEEVFRSLLEAGEIERSGETWRGRSTVALRIPRSLRHAVEARLLSVSPTAAQVAELAAVLGQSVDVSLLGRLSGFDERTLLAALRDLRDIQVLSSGDEAAGSSGLAFRHALTREAVLARLIAPERRALHRRVARLLEEEGEAPPALLAHHWSQAGDPESAAPYALRAARGAAGLHAHREAIRHFELALAPTGSPNAEILLSLGDHHAALGELDLAVQRYQEARGIFRARGEPTREAEAALRLGLCEGQHRRRNAALDSLRAAWLGLPPGHADRWRAGLWLGLQHAAQGEYARATAVLEEARDAASEAGPLARLRIVYELGGIRAATGDWAELDRAGTRVLREVDGDSDDALALRLDAHHALGCLACYRGAFAAAGEHFRASRILADRVGQLVDRALADWNLAGNVLAPLGQWAEARARLVELAATAPPWIATLAGWYGLWLDGQWEAALAEATKSWPDYDRDADVEGQVGVAMRILDVQLALGRADDALVLTRELLGRPTLREATTYAVRLTPYQVEAMVRLQDPEAPAIIARGLDLAGRLGARREEAWLLRSRAFAARDLGNWCQVFDDVDAALAIFQALGMLYEVARTLRQEALLRLRRGRRGDRDRAASALHASRAWFLQVGARRDLADVDRILAGAGLISRGVPVDVPGLERLSPREREVARAIADGLTNPAIAARLFLSERTVAHHVSAILRKLGLDSRSQVAALVARDASAHPGSWPG